MRRHFFIFATYLFILLSALLQVAWCKENYRAPAVEPWMEVAESQNNSARNLPKNIPIYNFSPKKQEKALIYARATTPLLVFMIVIFPVALWVLTLALLKRPDQKLLNEEIIFLNQKKKSSSAKVTKSSKKNTQKFPKAS